MCQFPGSEDREPEIPTAIRNWRLERFLFSMPRETVSQPSFGAFFPRSLGDLFIRSYFKLVHPQLPILDYQKVLSEWEASWKAHDVIDKQPEVSRQNKEVLFMALAIGARVCPTMNQDSFKLADTWAEHFSQRVEIPLSALEEPSLHLVRVFLLKVHPSNLFLYTSIYLPCSVVFLVGSAFDYLIRSILDTWLMHQLVTGHLCPASRTHKRCLHVPGVCCSYYYGTGNKPFL